MEISKIDTLVYPCWLGGQVPAPESGVIEKTGIHVSYSRRASGSQRNIWKKFANQIQQDPSRLMIIVNEEETLPYFNNNDKLYSSQFEIVKYAQQTLGNRCIMSTDIELGAKNHAPLDVIKKEHLLADKLSEQGFYVSGNTEFLSYGHHRGDCTLNVGERVLASLRLDVSKLKEHKRASVAAHSSLIREIVQKYSPNLFAEIEGYYPEIDFEKNKATVKIVRLNCPDKKTQIQDSRAFYNNLWHLMLCTLTPLQIKHTVKRTNSIEELFDVLGAPDFLKNISGYDLSRIVDELLSTKKVDILI